MYMYIKKIIPLSLIIAFHNRWNEIFDLWHWWNQSAVLDPLEAYGGPHIPSRYGCAFFVMEDKLRACVTYTNGFSKQKHCEYSCDPNMEHVGGFNDV